MCLGEVVACSDWMFYLNLNHIDCSNETQGTAQSDP